MSSIYEIAETLLSGQPNPIKQAEEMNLFEALNYLSYKNDVNEGQRKESEKASKKGRK